MAIKNDKELTKAIMNTMQGALRDIQNKAYDVVKKYMDTYYTEYTPAEYKRTYAFYKSLVKGDIVKTSTGYKCSIYIDLDRMDNYYRNSGKEVMDMINRGFHADPSLNGSERIHNGIYSDPYSAKDEIEGTAVWDEAIEEIEKTGMILKTFESFFDKNFNGGR